MEIEVLSHSKQRSETIKAVAEFYVEKLNLTNSKYKVFICTDPSLKKDGNNGLCAKTGKKEITVAVYSRLDNIKLLYTLAHEFVHVKQIARGQYTQKTVRGRVQHFWLGQRVSKKYIERPWEIEAFGRESILVEHLCDRVVANRKKNKKRS